MAKLDTIRHMLDISMRAWRFDITPEKRAYLANMYARDIYAMHASDDDNVRTADAMQGVLYRLMNLVPRDSSYKGS